MSIISIMGGLDPSQKIQAMQKQSQQNFDVADSNQDGVVSSAEFMEVLSAQGVDSAKASEFVSALDTDGDGNITQQEHEQLMQDMQQRMSDMMSRMQGDAQGYGNEQNDRQASFDSFKSMLADIAQDSKDQDTSNRLQGLLEQLESNGYSQENVENSMSLINKVAPPINTTA